MPLDEDHRAGIVSLALRLPRLLLPEDAQMIHAYMEKENVAGPNTQKAFRLFDKTVQCLEEFSEYLSTDNGSTQFLQLLHSLPKLSVISIETPDFFPIDIYHDSDLIDTPRYLETNLHSITILLRILANFLPTRPSIQLSLQYIDSTFFTIFVRQPSLISSLRSLSRLELDFCQRDTDLHTPSSTVYQSLLLANNLLRHCVSLRTLTIASRNRYPEAHHDDGASALDFATLTADLVLPCLETITVVRFDTCSELLELLLDHEQTLKRVRLYGVRVAHDDGIWHIISDDETEGLGCHVADNQDRSVKYSFHNCSATMSTFRKILSRSQKLVEVSAGQDEW